MPLHDAAKEGNFEAVKELLALGAPYMPRSKFGELPADYAKQAGHTIIAEFLGNAKKASKYHKKNLFQFIDALKS